MLLMVSTEGGLSAISSIVLIVLLTLATLHGSTEVNFLTGQHSTRYLSLLCLALSDFIHASGLVYFRFSLVVTKQVMRFAFF